MEPASAGIDLEEFYISSEKLGSNWHLCQATGGNTSFKHNSGITIKSSGVSLSKSRNNKKAFTYVEANKKSDQKPSMEIGFHKLIDYKFVYHYHPLNFLLCSILGLSRELLDSLKLNNFNVLLLEFIAPGDLLFTKIKSELSEYKQTPEIILLENHGIIVSSNKIKESEQIIDVIESKCIEVLAKRKVFLDELSPKWKNDSKYMSSIEYIELNQLLLEAIEKGVKKSISSYAFFPDQCVYLGSNNKIWDIKDENSYKSMLQINKIDKICTCNNNLTSIQKEYAWVNAYLMAGIGLSNILTIKAISKSCASTFEGNKDELYRLNRSENH